MRRFELLLAIYRYVLAILRKKKKKKEKQNRGGSLKKRNTKMRMTRERRRRRRIYRKSVGLTVERTLETRASP